MTVRDHGRRRERADAQPAPEQDEIRRGFELLSELPGECVVDYVFEAQREVVLGDADEVARVVECPPARKPQGGRGHGCGRVVQSD